jgi:hypothetical protein
MILYLAALCIPVALAVWIKHFLDYMHENNLK